MRWWVLVALFALFYFSRFPTLSISDLIIISGLAMVCVVLAIRTLVALLKSLVEEAYDDRIDSFISRSWARYRNHGFNKDMTYRLAKCFIVLACVKYGFDAIKHAAEHVPVVQPRAFWAEIIGASVLLMFAIKEGVWLRLASNFRRDMQEKPRLSMGTFFKLYTKPVSMFCLVLYAPTLIRASVAATVWGITMLAPESALFAAPVAQCGPYKP
jgi:hypothetical protein